MTRVSLSGATEEHGGLGEPRMGLGAWETGLSPKTPGHHRLAKLTQKIDHRRVRIGEGQQLKDLIAVNSLLSGHSSQVPLGRVTSRGQGPVTQRKNVR